MSEIDSKNKINRVVMVDDNDDHLFLQGKALRSAIDGVAVEGHLYGAEALEALTAEDASPVDLLLIDLNMPKMNGIELADALMRSRPASIEGTHVAMVSTSDSPEDLKRAVDHPMIDSVLCKPLTKQSLAGFLATLNQD